MNDQQFEEMVRKIETEVHAEAKSALGARGFERWRNPQFCGVMTDADSQARLTGGCAYPREHFQGRTGRECRRGHPAGLLLEAEAGDRTAPCVMHGRPLAGKHHHKTMHPSCRARAKPQHIPQMLDRGKGPVGQLACGSAAQDFYPKRSTYSERQYKQDGDQGRRWVSPPGATGRRRGDAAMVSAPTKRRKRW